ncbi:hypothetical protein EG68_06513 [Paragonimus skrjabini miyazakii]|uniref:Uncharacterized protein n=1 Tax=Paragonimus skrjabini miyazakii TaxID=59628 RepID=A0A8S9YT39_9TREM|nr:hypothetical protein EG68_06513 [Paragonimus skrjabini miyazakii]
MEAPTPALRLHQIHSNMPFGRTNYVPEEETRNLCANFPEADILQPFKELATSEKPRQESFQLTEKLACKKPQCVEYCNDISSKTLSHPDYRKLSWTYLQGDYEDSLDVSRRTKVVKATSPNAMHTGGKQTSLPSEMVTSRLESRYRMENAIPFCLNPQAAYLIHHSSITGQRKRVEQELGTSVIYLNDRSHLKGLEQRLQARWERRSDDAHHNRLLAELQKTRETSTDELSQLMEAPSKLRDTIDPREEANKVRALKKSVLTDKTHDYSSDFVSPEPTRSTTSGKADQPDILDSLPSVVDGTTEPSETKRAVSKRSSLTRTESEPPTLDSVDGLLSSRLSIGSLYNNAEQSVKSREPLPKRTLKYSNLSWERD